MTTDARTLQVNLERARPADAGDLALVAAATFLETYAGALRAEDILHHCQTQHAPAAYEDWLADADCALWLARVQPGNAPVGYMLASPPDVVIADPRPGDVEVKRLYLLHRFQGNGLGRRMMDTAAGWARSRGARRLLLGVYSKNEPALAFYRRVGFTVVGDRTFRVGDSEFYDYILGLELPA